MRYIKNVLSGLLAVGMLMLMSTGVFAQGRQDVNLEEDPAFSAHAPQQARYENEALEDIVASRTIKRMIETNTQCWEQYDTQFEFLISTDVIYLEGIGKYALASVEAPRPRVIIKSFSGANAVSGVPTIEPMEDGRTIVVTSKVMIQNATGYTEDKELKMFLYFDSETGSVSISEY